MKKVVLSMVAIAILATSLSGNERDEFDEISSFLKISAPSRLFTDIEISNLLPKMREKKAAVLKKENEKKLSDYRMNKNTIAGTEFSKNLEYIDNYITNPAPDLMKLIDANLDSIETSFKEAQNYNYENIVNSNKILYGEAKNIGKFYEEHEITDSILGGKNANSPYYMGFIQRIYELSPSSGNINFNLNSTKNSRGQDLTINFSNNSQVFIRIFNNIQANPLAYFGICKIVYLPMTKTLVPNLDRIKNLSMSTKKRLMREHNIIPDNKPSIDETIFSGIYDANNMVATEEEKEFMMRLKKRLDSFTNLANDEKKLFLNLLNGEQEKVKETLFNIFGEEYLKRSFLLIAKKKLVAMNTPLFDDFEFDAGDIKKSSLEILKEDFESADGENKLKQILRDAITQKNKGSVLLIKKIFGDEKYFKLVNELIESQMSEKLKYEQDKKESQKVLREIFR